jgi:nitric oxide reductase NorE protein
MSQVDPVAIAANAAGTEARHTPGEPGLWVLLCGDMMVFTVFFVMFAWHRCERVDLYRASQAHLNQVFGILNTFLMLSSSWFVATAVQASRRNRLRLASGCFRAGLLCGVLFCIVKIFEYGEKFRADITPSTNDFFLYYYIFTGVHLLHVIIGMLVLGILSSYVRTGNCDAAKIRNIEGGACFWHVVDLLWIVLFALFYVAL